MIRLRVQAWPQYIPTHLHFSCRKAQPQYQHRYCEYCHQPSALGDETHIFLKCHPLQTSNGLASCLETPLPPSSRNIQRSGCRSVFLCSIHTRRSFGPSSAPYYPHLPRSLKTSAPTRTLKPGNLHRRECWGPRECTHAQTYLYTHTHTHIHIRTRPIVHIGNENIAFCTSPSARHSLYVTPYTSPSTHHPLHAILCTSLSANRPLHVTLCTSPPTCHPLYVTPHTSLPVCRPLAVTLCTSLSARHPPHVILCSSLSERHSLHATLCTSISARHPLHIILGTSLSVRHSPQVTLCIRTRTCSMIYIGFCGRKPCMFGTG